MKAANIQDILQTDVLFKDIEEVFIQDETSTLLIPKEENFCIPVYFEGNNINIYHDAAIRIKDIKGDYDIYSRVALFSTLSIKFEDNLDMTKILKTIFKKVKKKESNKLNIVEDTILDEWFNFSDCTGGHFEYSFIIPKTKEKIIQVTVCTPYALGLLYLNNMRIFNTDFKDDYKFKPNELCVLIYSNIFNFDKIERCDFDKIINKYIINMVPKKYKCEYDIVDVDKSIVIRL